MLVPLWGCPSKEKVNGQAGISIRRLKPYYDKDPAPDFVRIAGILKVSICFPEFPVPQ
jgi:hypothetical protein